MPDLSVDIEDWCQSYVSAFSSFDSEAISKHWAFPALIVSGKHNLIFENARAFNQNTIGLLGFYKEMDVARANRRLDSYLPMGQGTMAITVTDEMLNRQNNLIVTWQASYVLRLYGTKWLAVMANADGELAAWKARGTPLRA